MGLRKVMNTSSTIINSQADTKEKLLKEIAQLASAQEAPKKAGIREKDILSSLKKREHISSTGLSHGIAVPHCSFPSVDEFTIGTIITKDPIDFDAADGNPSQIFVFLIGPEQARNQHIRYLSAISKALQEKQVRTALLNARSPEAVLDIFSKQIPYTAPRISGEGMAQLTLYIQLEEYFDDILETLSSEVEGSIAVIETENARNYLYRMPLFSAFWDAKQGGFSRIITAVIDKQAVNQTIRKLQNNLPDMESNSGVLLTVQDLGFAIGSIDF
ncbi:MAG: PTS sugar transporter subunit IIA [Spirochaetales bacterium]|nr:PTS sugar transporter subunit IIA [Spirochaetales bacterium]